MNGSAVESEIRRIPKLSLHCHLEGSVRPTTVLRLAQEYAVEPPRRNAAKLYDFANFGEFLQCFRLICTVLQQPRDFGCIAREFCEDARAQGVVYGEIFISPSAWQKVHPQLDVRTAVEAIAQAFAQARRHDFELHLIVDLTRNFGPASALETLRLALQWREYGVIGIGLGGDEVNFPAALFADAFAQARRANFAVVAHAGEAAGPHSVRDAVLKLGATRIGHGVRASDDPALLEWLRERSISFEQAPTSNLRTGAISRLSDHPMARFVQAGLAVCVDADDPPLFGTTISRELALVAELYGVVFMHDRLRDAISMSFADELKKRALALQLETALAASSISGMRAEP